MRKHTTFAYEMLSPIHYLQPALDIPYSHHEKWDGTGYPRGLSGDQIPFAARIFAVVDVWDALTSDRPYRAAWPEESIFVNLPGAQAILERIPTLKSGNEKIRLSLTSKSLRLPQPFELQELELVLLLQRAVKVGILPPDFVKSLGAEFEI